MDRNDRRRDDDRQSSERGDEGRRTAYNPRYDYQRESGARNEGPRYGYAGDYSGGRARRYRRFDDRADYDFEHGDNGPRDYFAEYGKERGADYETGYLTDRPRDFDRDFGRQAGGFDRPYSESPRTAEQWRVPGPYAGRGPASYTQDVNRVRNAVCERLTDHGRLDASNIEVTVENGEVTLEGTVSSRADKRLAEDLAESVSGVRDVHNRLRVQEREERRESRRHSSGDGHHGTPEAP